MAYGGEIFYRFFIGEKSHLGIVAPLRIAELHHLRRQIGNQQDIPDVKYSAVAGGLDLALAVRAGVASRRCLLPLPLQRGGNGTAAWFPQTSQGVDALLGFGIELGRSFESAWARSSGTGHSFSPSPAIRGWPAAQRTPTCAASRLLAWRL